MAHYNAKIVGKHHPSFSVWMERLAEVCSGRIPDNEQLEILVDGRAVIDLRDVEDLVDRTGSLQLRIGTSPTAVILRTDAGQPSPFGSTETVEEGVALADLQPDPVAVDLAGSRRRSADEPVARTLLGDKATPLLMLDGMIDRWSIPLCLTVPHARWTSSRADVLQRVAVQFADQRIIVRSACSAEDSWLNSAAGQFLTVADVDPADRGAVGQAVDLVYESYGEALSDAEQVLIQRFVADSVRSGVAMTAHPDTSAPYVVITEDQSHGRTDLVTSGTTESATTWYIDRLHVGGVPDHIAPVVDLCIRLQSLLGVDQLDCEYSIGASGQGHLLQVRPIAGTPELLAPVLARRRRVIDEAVTTYRQRSVGGCSIYSTMSDWNPAEMIGRRPLPLARSLYQRLITDQTWSRQRYQYGYQDLRGTALMTAFASAVYIDVNASLRSFIPAGTPPELEAAIVAGQLDQIRSDPSLHDRIEFDVALSCAVPHIRATVQERFGHLTDDGANLDHLVERLKLLTVDGLTGQRRHRNQAQELERHRRARPVMIERLSAELDRLVDYGTLPFSHLARTAFVATTMVRSLERHGFIADAEVRAILGSVHSVTTDFVQAIDDLAVGAISIGEFVSDHGHTRPGTYDIRVPTYGRNLDHYIEPVVAAARTRRDRQAPTHFQPSRDLLDRIDAGLVAAELNLDLDANRFLTLAVRAIEGREFAKSVFSASLSDLLEALAHWGSGIGLSRDALAAVELGTISKAVALDGRAAHRLVAEKAERNTEKLEIARSVELPDVIREEHDFHWFRSFRQEAAYVTSDHVVAQPISVDRIDSHDLSGRVVVLEQADPGYDWILSLYPAAIITAYGGMNSHMMVRCTELGIPAAVGVGRETYHRVLRASVVHLDCQGRRISLE